jgi:DNA-binding transcriptional MerR regulator
MTTMTMTTETTIKTQIPDRLYFRIGDVAELVGVKPYVLRYWESEFPLVSPQKTATGQRVYRRSDVESLLMIKHLLYTERYSIEGARKRIKELRKDGKLKTFKQEAATGASPSAAPAQEAEPTEAHGINPGLMTADFVKQLRSEAKELKSLAESPIQELFRY